MLMLFIVLNSQNNYYFYYYCNENWELDFSINVVLMSTMYL